MRIYVKKKNVTIKSLRFSFVFLVHENIVTTHINEIGRLRFFASSACRSGCLLSVCFARVLLMRFAKSPYYVFIIYILTRVISSTFLLLLIKRSKKQKKKLRMWRIRGTRLVNNNEKKIFFFVFLLGNPCHSRTTVRVVFQATTEWRPVSGARDSLRVVVQFEHVACCGRRLVPRARSRPLPVQQHRISSS